MRPENPAAAKPMPIFLATRNRHKTREIQEMLGSGVLVTDATGAANLPEIEETGVTFEENSRLKAEGISLHVHGIVLADDSGLEVDALGREPGVLRPLRRPGMHRRAEHGARSGENQGHPPRAKNSPFPLCAGRCGAGGDSCDL